MDKNKKKRLARERRHRRVRVRVMGTQERPRLNIFRSMRHIYAQVIDDRAGHTLTSASTVEPEVQKEVKGKSKSEQAAIVGKIVAERAVQAGIKEVVFDRGGYQYHGRVKVLAEAAREGGLEF
jgi:large subunit ribosomal protein L18